MTAPELLPALPLAREAASGKPPRRYMPGLDVLRGLAILMVLIYHGLESDVAPAGSHPGAGLELLQKALLYGSRGVHLFFVLSGFLITGILLDSRGDRDYFKNFYLRRALRIVPAYLLMIAVLKLSHAISWRFTLVSVLYFCNMAAMFRATPEYGSFWSLSVEEQFYLVWPMVVATLRRRALLILSVAIVVLTPVLRFALLYGPAVTRDIVYKTWDVGDFFAAGAILAIAIRTRTDADLSRAVKPLLLTGVALLALLLWVPEPARKGLQNLLQAVQLEPWLLLFTGMTLFGFLRPGIAKIRLFGPLVFLSNISYGLYLCHSFLFAVIAKHWGLGDADSDGYMSRLLLRFVVESAVAIAVAYVSRRTFEEFFLRLKPKHHPALAT